MVFCRKRLQSSNSCIMVQYLCVYVQSERIFIFFCWQPSESRDIESSGVGSFDTQTFKETVHSHGPIHHHIIFHNIFKKISVQTKRLYLALHIYFHTVTIILVFSSFSFLCVCADTILLYGLYVFFRVWQWRYNPVAQTLCHRGSVDGTMIGHDGPLQLLR